MYANHTIPDSTTRMVPLEVPSTVRPDNAGCRECPASKACSPILRDGIFFFAGRQKKCIFASGKSQHRKNHDRQI